jgi:hypothetical protein
MSERKTALTPEEKITAAFMHFVRQVEVQDIAMMYGINMGRVSDACRDVGVAVGLRQPRVNVVPVREREGPA